MKLNKVIETKWLEKIYIVQFNEQEFEDLHSSMGMAVRVVDSVHRDSPQFRRAVHKLKRGLQTLHKDALNRLKQKEK